MMKQEVLVKRVTSDLPLEVAKELMLDAFESRLTRGDLICEIITKYYKEVQDAKSKKSK